MIHFNVISFKKKSNPIELKLDIELDDDFKLIDEKTFETESEAMAYYYSSLYDFLIRAFERFFKHKMKLSEKYFLCGYEDFDSALPMLKALENEIYYQRTHDLSSLANAFLHTKPHFDTLMSYTPRKDQHIDKHIVGVIMQKSRDIYDYFNKQSQKVA